MSVTAACARSSVASIARSASVCDSSDASAALHRSSVTRSSSSSTCSRPAAAAPSSSSARTRASTAPTSCCHRCPASPSASSTPCSRPSTRCSSSSAARTRPVIPVMSPPIDSSRSSLRAASAVVTSCRMAPIARSTCPATASPTASHTSRAFCATTVAGLPLASQPKTRRSSSSRKAGASCASASPRSMASESAAICCSARSLSCFAPSFRCRSCCSTSSMKPRLCCRNWSSPAPPAPPPPDGVRGADRGPPPPPPRCSMSATRCCSACISCRIASTSPVTASEPPYACVLTAACRRETTSSSELTFVPSCVSCCAAALCLPWLVVSSAFIAATRSLRSCDTEMRTSAMLSVSWCSSASGLPTSSRVDTGIGPRAAGVPMKYRYCSF
eukprot:Rhum_TRINITY_DN11707_c0_g2::Rhum_TRINITY_DN11707_c0_g2_i1::g.46383::m.46383